LEKSVIVLAGGSSSRVGQDKGSLRLANKPMVKHVLEKVNELVEEEIVVVSSKFQAEKYSCLLGRDVNVVVDLEEISSPLVGALTGFEASSGRLSLVLSCDVPFVSKQVLSLLLDLSAGKTAVIPRWPNGYLEPLQAVYSVKPTMDACKNALEEGSLRMQAMVDKLRGVRFVSTLVIEQIDPELMTFFNINTQLDLKKAEAMLRKPIK
jgi:molybdopterin-guanine dinucleotide biosynthesis protein A